MPKTLNEAVLKTGKILCICGTDTDAGKTVVTAGLLRAAVRLGLDAQAIKPVQTGGIKRYESGNAPELSASEAAAAGLEAPDVLVYREAAPGARAFALTVLEEACSPHLAAARSGLELSAAALAAELRAVSAGAGLTLVEAAGGLLAPLNNHESMADVFTRLGAPVLLVAANRLGAINHALLTVEALRGRGIEPIGLVLAETSGPAEEPGKPEASGEAEGLRQLILRDNAVSIARLGRVPLLAEVPYLHELDSGTAALPAVARGYAWDALAGRLEPVVKLLFQDGTPAGPDAPAVPGSPAGAESTAGSLSALLKFDRDHLWHPYTSALDPLKCWEAFKTEGPYIWLRDCDERGRILERRVVDGMSSWWAAVHGYNHPRLLAALRGQAERMPHVMFGGITHEPAVELAEKLLELAPSNLEHVFLADSGSVAVEVALKMAVQYQRAVTGGSEKSAVLTVRGGYHGDTLGAMSVCDPVNGMHSLFSAVLPEQIFAPRPECRFDREFDPASLNPVRELFAARQREIAAVIIEPVVQGAGGMWFYHPEYLRGLKELCLEYGALLILDEIATGFGRTGKMFACEWAGIQPDIMCVGKALTGGMMTLAATLASREVARGLSAGTGRSGQGGVLMHGPTFMGNPLACAVAGGSLSLLSGSCWRSRVEEMEAILKSGLEPCRNFSGVRDARVLGGIGVVELERRVNVERLQDFFVRQCGVWIRPFGGLIYLMPPYVTPARELEKLTAAVREAVESEKWV